MIIGIDPGYATIGYAFISSTSTPRVMDLGVITTNKEEKFFSRLNEIEKNLSELIEKHRPDQNFSYQAAIEKIFLVKNKKTAIDVAQARGVICNLLHRSGVIIHEYSPNEVKKAATGRGLADKEEVQTMIQRFLNLKNPIKQDDAADALAIAICHWFYQEKHLLPI